MREASAPLSSAYAPTATQVVAFEHETPIRLSPPVAGFALATMLHDVPFHRSASVSDPSPTASHALIEVQETPFNLFTCDDLTLGLDTIDHDDPVHRSVSVRTVARVGAYSPPAKQPERVGHDTACNALVVPEGLGLGLIAHCLPFQCSMSVSCAPDVEMDPPTAKQVEAAAQETPVSVAPCPGVGLGIGNHAAPFHRAV